MKVKSLFIVGVLFSLNTTLNMAQARTDGLHEFVFNVHVPKNTCDIIIEGTSNNTVDFGNIPISKFKSDVPEGKVKLPFNVKLQNCKTTNFQGAYIKLSGSYSEENNGFLDDNGKSFAVRISNKDNATPSDTDFFTEQNNKMWTGINSTNMNRTYYAYVMCKTGASDNMRESADEKIINELTLPTEHIIGIADIYFEGFYDMPRDLDKAIEMYQYLLKYEPEIALEKLYESHILNGNTNEAYYYALILNKDTDNVTMFNTLTDVQREAIKTRVQDYFDNKNTNK